MCGTRASSRRTRLPCLCCDDNAFEAISEHWSIANAFFWKSSALQQQTPKHPGMARLSCPGHRPHEKRARREQKSARAGRVGRGQLAIEIRPNLRLATCRSGRLPPSRRPLETRRNGNLSGRGYRQTLVAVQTREGDALSGARQARSGGRVRGASCGRLAGKLK